MSHPQGIQRRLRLIRPITHNKIKQNLQPLVQNNKKKVAQKFYYQQHPIGASPLIRDEKPPVHQRLGAKQIRLRRLVPLGTSTFSILPKRKIIKFPNRVENNFKKQKIQRYYSAQSRIERIRAQHRNNTAIKLRRLNGSMPLATNLTVEVKNPNFVPSDNDLGPKFGFQKFKMILDPQIQAEILEIQKDGPPLLVSLPSSTRITPVVTTVGISERFAML